MPYLRLPRTAVPVVATATVVLVVWLGWESFRDPETLWAPGNLSRYHADVARCASCHEPFQGPSSTKCLACHSEKQFAARSKPSVRDFHREVIAQRKTCLACHTEHRGGLAQITTNAMFNPHGEFIFRATGTGSCSACHGFELDVVARPALLDNEVVRQLFDTGKGVHRRGRMANCMQCHVGGQREIEDVEQKK